MEGYGLVIMYREHCVEEALLRKTILELCEGDEDLQQFAAQRLLAIVGTDRDREKYVALLNDLERRQERIALDIVELAYERGRCTWKRRNGGKLRIFD